jgi:hypothetical protein
MKYTVEMGSGDIHTKFRNDWFKHSEFDRGIHRQNGGCISRFYFFKISRLKNKSRLVRSSCCLCMYVCCHHCQRNSSQNFLYINNIYKTCTLRH